MKPHVVHIVHKHSGKIEHICAVMYAGCETFQLHHYIYFVSVGLFVFGLIVQFIGLRE